MRRLISLFVFVLVVAHSQAWAEGKVNELDIATAKSLYDRGVVFIDARSERSYKNSHIVGSHSLPVFGGNFNEVSLAKIVGKDQPVVFYCNCHPGCNISPAAANAAMKKFGYKDVYYVKAAIDGWREAGYALEKVD